MTAARARKASQDAVHGRRLRTILVLGLALWGFIVFRLAMIQIVHSPRLAACAERQHIVPVRLAPERGTIYDRDMRPLTDNLRVESVCAYPKEIESPSAVARSLARVLDGSYDHYKRLLSKEKGFVWVERQIAPSQAAKLADMDLDGIDFLTESKRIYPHGKRASHVLGFTDVDGRGLAGIELEFDELLSGSEEWVCHYLDNRQRRTPTPACTKVVPRDGHSIVLTIDSRLQSIAEVELERGVREQEAKSGIVIIQDPWTGDILAMANWPTFDSNVPQVYSVANRRNRAITDQFEPGSTFKLVTASAALSSGAADLNSVYYAHRGSRRFGSFRPIRDVKEHGWMTFRAAFAKSSNICFAEIASSVGDVPLYSFARDFGFGCFTGIQLPGEVRGVLRDPSEWSQRSVHTIGIGQEVAVTALQLAGAYSAVANGGYLMEPRIVKELISADGDIVETNDPWTVRRVISEDVAEMLRDLMVQVTERGTGGNARVAEFAVAGKTGTAQKVVEGVRGYAPGKWIGSFAGFAPAYDPQIVCVVVMDEPKGRGLGGEAAAPVFSRIVERMARSSSNDMVVSDLVVDSGSRSVTDEPSLLPFPSLGLFDLAEAAVATSAGAGGGAIVPAAHTGASASVVTADGAHGGDVTRAGTEDGVEAPDLRGMSIRLARREAASVGLELHFEGSGSVRTQSPRPGADLRRGDKIVVSCHQG